MIDPSRTSLVGKVAIVTGAGMGMGEATARLIAARGAKVAVVDINGDAAEQTSERIRSVGGEALTLQIDVSDEQAVEEMVARSVAEFGRLDCAVNNAAVAPDRQPIAEADMAAFDHIIRINLRSVMLCMKFQIAQLLRQGSPGSIVNIGSVNSVRPQLNTAAYTAAKHGVIGLTKSGSLEYAPRGIRVNAVLPGAIATPMIRETMHANKREESDVATVLSLFGRLGDPEEVAEASAWLCSDASSFVTGHALAVDAGYLSR